MSNKAREYKPRTIKRLYTLSGNECAVPNCEKHLIARDTETIISKICHIEAASEKGARYNSRMTDDDRRHFDNLVLLCDECHSIVDNPDNESKYPVLLLKQWKKDHESKMLYKLSTRPSLLIDAINAISQIDLEDAFITNTEDLKTFQIEEKITQNSIKRNKSLINEYKIYYSKINSLYNELEAQGSFKKEKLLRYIKKIYLEVKGKYIGNATNGLEIIRENADNIIEDIQNILSEKIASKKNIYKEDVEFGIEIIMVDAFMRCKILEEPI